LRGYFGRVVTPEFVVPIGLYILLLYTDLH